MSKQTFSVNSYDRFFIANEWRTPSSTDTFRVINPATEQTIAAVRRDAQRADLDSAVMAAREAFDHGPWPRMSAADRADCMKELSAALQQDIPGLAWVITREMGCPVSFSTAGQTYASIMVLDYFAGLARSFPFEQDRQGMMGPVKVRQEAVGVVAAITPWNVPLFTAMLNWPGTGRWLHRLD